MPDYISVLLFNVKKQKFVLVKKFIPAIYSLSLGMSDKFGKIDLEKYPPENGVNYELCGADIPSEKCISEDFAVKVIKSQTGFAVCPSKLQKIAKVQRNLGRTQAKETIYFCSISNDSCGPPTNDETEVIELSPLEMRCFLGQDLINTSDNLLLAVQWFLSQQSDLINQCSNL